MAMPPLAPALHDGPNCFNASMYLQGFVQEQVFVSFDEVHFYLDNFCAEKAATAKMEARDVITFEDPQDPSLGIIHTAVSLGDGMILEKNSVYGSLVKRDLSDDPEAGQYLQHPRSESLYMAPKSQAAFGTVYSQRVFACQSENDFKLNLASLQTSAAVQEQLAFRKALDHALKSKTRAELESLLLNSLTPQVERMTWDYVLTKMLTNPVEAKYLYTLLVSNSYQFYLLSCSESLAVYGECYAPSLQKPIDVANVWVKKIDEYQKTLGLKPGF